MESPAEAGFSIGVLQEERTRVRPTGGVLRHEFDRLGPVETGLTLAPLWHQSRHLEGNATAAEVPPKLTKNHPTGGLGTWIFHSR
jgi:hypothetical protein